MPKRDGVGGFLCHGQHVLQDYLAVLVVRVIRILKPIGQPSNRYPGIFGNPIPALSQNPILLENKLESDHQVGALILVNVCPLAKMVELKVLCCLDHA